MQKYHISPKTGNPNVCKAEEGQCPLGGEHFETKEEAQQYFEKSQSSLTLVSSEKLSSKDRLAEISEKTAELQKSGATEDILQLRKEWLSVATDFAATDEGQAYFTARLEQVQGQKGPEALVTKVLHEGHLLRAQQEEADAFVAVASLPALPDAAVTKIAVMKKSELPILPAPERFSVEITSDERDSWVAAHKAMKRLESNVVAGSVYSSSLVVDARKHIFKDLATVSTASDLEKMLDGMAYASRFKMYPPNFYTSTKASITSWQSAASAIDVQREKRVQAILAHPSATDETWEKGLSVVQEHEREAILLMPVIPPTALANEVRQNPEVSEKVWEKIRSERMESNDLNVVATAYEPDSFHRMEAMNQLMVTPIDTLNANTQQWLASNLHRLPGGEANQKMLAQSIVHWAKASLSTQEQDHFKKLLVRNANSEVSKIAATFGSPPEEKRPWWRGR